jgi:hypothetical protein
VLLDLQKGGLTACLTLVRTDTESVRCVLPSSNLANLWS